MGARVSSAVHGTFLAFRHTRCTVINASSLGIMRIASEYGRRIQWSLYEAVLETEGSLGNGVEFILLDILSLNFVCSELS